MKKIVLLLMLIFCLEAEELQVYGGKVKIGNNNGIYSGILYNLKSEDETLDIKLGYKRVNIYDDNFIQNETYISMKREIDLDKHLEFAFQNINNKINNGNIYVLNWYKQNEVDYKIGGSFSKYEKDIAYQLSLQMNKFIGTTSFYLEPDYYLIYVKDERFFNSLNLKVGYLEGKNDIYFSFLGGKNRYLVSDDKYYSCNLGYITKYAYKMGYAYQLNPNFIIKLSHYNYKLVDSKLKAYNLAIAYKY